jgi:hypothetical protein
VSYLIEGVTFYSAEVIVKCPSHLHMRNMLICNFYRDFVMETVKMLQPNTSSTFQIIEFHIKRCFIMYTEV